MILTIETTKTEDGYIAEVKELKCIGTRETELEALEDVSKVMLDVLELADKDNIIKLGK